MFRRALTYNGVCARVPGSKDRPLEQMHHTFLFSGGARRRSRGESKKAWQHIRARAGTKDVRIHDLRAEVVTAPPCPLGPRERDIAGHRLGRRPSEEP